MGSVKTENTVSELEFNVDKLEKQQEELMSRVLTNQEQHQAEWSEFLWQQQRAVVTAETADDEHSKQISKNQKLTSKQRSSSRLTKSSAQLSSKFANFQLGSGRLTTSTT